MNHLIIIISSDKTQSINQWCISSGNQDMSDVFILQHLVELGEISIDQFFVFRHGIFIDFAQVSESFLHSPGRGGIMTPDNLVEAAQPVGEAAFHSDCVLAGFDIVVYHPVFNLG